MNNQSIKTKKKNLKWIWIIGGVFIFALIIASGGSEKTTQPAQISQPIQEKQQTTEEKTQQEADEQIREGTERVAEEPKEQDKETKKELKTDLCVSTNCSNCQYCSSGACIDYCKGIDVSCGCTSCVNCNASDRCSGDAYSDYYCSGTSCVFNNDDCSDCSCSCGGYNKEESNSNKNCSDGKDNDCDGLIDGEESDCIDPCIPECEEKCLKKYPFTSYDYILCFTGCLEICNIRWEIPF